MKSIRSRVLLIAALALGAIYYISPTLIYFSQDKEVRNDQESLAKAIPNWLPKKHIKQSYKKLLMVHQQLSLV